MITEVVKRGPLELSITERGNIDSAANVTLTCLVEGEAGTAIIKIVDEGTRAKAGDVLIELDSSRLRNEAISQQIVVEQAIATEQSAEKNVAIQETQNESDIAAAKLKLELAQLDLEKYKEGDYIQAKNTAQGQITLAREDLTRTQERYEFSVRQYKKGYATQSELDADRIAVSKAQIAFNGATEALVVLEKYDYKRQMAEKKANALEFDRELQRVKLKAEAALAQYKATLSAQKLTTKVEKEKYEKTLDQIRVCTVTAPRDGLVVYANSRSGGRGSSQDPLIYEGAKVRERQALINLPDITRMQVNARVHESKIDMVREQLPAKIRVDARPGELFHGVVDTVSSVPMSGNWPNINLKEYVTTIVIQDSASKVSNLKPGLTAEVEILVDRVESCLQVPIQSVVERSGKHFAFVLKDEAVERREVKVGKTNDIQMEILDGLTEGQVVVLNPRAVLAREITKLEEDFPVVANDKTSGPAPKMPPPGATSSDAKSKAAGGGRSGKKRGGPGGRGGDPAAFFKQLDADGDGKLSESEAPEFLKANFSRIDANGDKFIDEAEMAKARQAREAAGGGRGGPRPEAGGGQ